MTMTVRQIKTRKGAIAQFWLGTAEGRERLPGNSALGDWGEPSCFGCGWMATDPDEPPDIWSVWDQASLQRCHLVPHALGGPDTASNLVLLCARCHSEAPDVADPDYMLGWINAHPSWGVLFSEALEAALATRSISDGELDAFNRLGSGQTADAYVSLIHDWAIAVGGKFSYATLAACAVEAVRRQLTLAGSQLGGHAEEFE
jgi:hypothetical protein